MEHNRVRHLLKWTCQKFLQLTLSSWPFNKGNIFMKKKFHLSCWSNNCLIWYSHQNISYIYCLYLNVLRSIPNICYYKIRRDNPICSWSCSFYAFGQWNHCCRYETGQDEYLFIDHGHRILIYHLTIHLVFENSTLLLQDYWVFHFKYIH